MSYQSFRTPAPMPPEPKPPFPWAGVAFFSIIAGGVLGLAALIIRGCQIDAETERERAQWCCEKPIKEYRPTSHMNCVSWSEGRCVRMEESRDFTWRCAAWVRTPPDKNADPASCACAAGRRRRLSRDVKER